MNRVGTIGDNREFGVAAVSDVEINFVGGVGGANTSTNDTATVKYTDRYGPISAYALRADQTVQVVSLNGLSFTDPLTVIKNKSNTERFGIPIVTKMVVRILTANTNIKLRVFQR